jgi:hypothetical protein
MEEPPAVKTVAEEPPKKKEKGVKINYQASAPVKPAQPEGEPR